jgi:hypothetical protein
LRNGSAQVGLRGAAITSAIEAAPHRGALGEHLAVADALSQVVLDLRLLQARHRQQIMFAVRAKFASIVHESGCRGSDDDRRRQQEDRQCAPAFQFAALWFVHVLFSGGGYSPDYPAPEFSIAPGKGGRTMACGQSWCAD